MVTEIALSHIKHKEKSTHQHVTRSTRLMAIFIKEIQRHNPRLLHGYECQALAEAVRFHDVGKKLVDWKIVGKPGKLTEDEFSEMKKHSEYGYKIITLKENIFATTADASDPFVNSRIFKVGMIFHYAKNMTLTHHERWDGTGYPNRLKGKNIPFEGRMMALVDVYDALVGKRSYKPPYSHEKAMRIIRAGQGTQFDPQLTALFLPAADRFNSQQGQLKRRRDKKIGMLQLTINFIRQLLHP
ncbi:MAG: HD domain-containing protein [Desulfovibrio sp.]|nr:HD domain-containing protein [Desulfovibrio sp.]